MKTFIYFQLQHDGCGGRFVQQVLAQRGSELGLESPGRRPLDLRVQGPGEPQQPTEAGHFKRLPAGQPKRQVFKQRTHLPRKFWAAKSAYTTVNPGLISIQKHFLMAYFHKKSSFIFTNHTVGDSQKIPPGGKVLLKQAFFLTSAAEKLKFKDKTQTKNSRKKLSLSEPPYSNL